MPASHYILKGRVQGVGFRYFAYHVARDLHIQGWARNLRNGDLEIHAQGDPERMWQFLDQIRSGPSFAAVNSIEVLKVDEQDFTDFSIEH